MLKVKKLEENKKTKNKNVQTKNKGITLIALVITIIVILILAGVSINTLFGDNGLLTKAEEAREANSHAQVKDELQIEIYNYEMESRSGSTGESLIQYLGRVGYLRDYNKESPKNSYIISEEKLKGVQLGKGTDTTTGDVYVIEKEDLTTGNITKLAAVQESDVRPITKVAAESTGSEDWLLKYYKVPNDDSPKILLNLTSEEGTSAGSGETGGSGGGSQTVVDNVKIPLGYTVSNNEAENNVAEGLVIKNDMTNDEYVWIPVPKEIYDTKSEYNTENKQITAESTEDIEKVLRKYSEDYAYNSGDKDEWYAWKDTDEDNSVDDGEITTDKSDGNYNTGCGLNYNDYDALKKKMLKSVYENGGFWIGRYEAGIEGKLKSDVTGEGTVATPRTSKDNPIDNIKAVSQKDKYPYNYVTCSQAQKLASKMSTSDELTSSLMFGVQWNLVCKFLAISLEDDAVKTNSTSWGNYFNASFTVNSGEYTTSPSSGTWTQCSNTTKSGSMLLTTGASDRNCKLNIYDFAGNEWEWTLEKTTLTNSPCSNRGGYYRSNGYGDPASYRYDSPPTFSNYNYSFRVSLY